MKNKIDPIKESWPTRTVLSSLFIATTKNAIRKQPRGRYTIKCVATKIRIVMQA